MMAGMEQGGLPREKKRKPTPEQMAVVNAMNKAETARHRLLEYFGKGDYFPTLTYRVEARPPDMAKAKKDFTNLISKLRTRYKKEQIELRWIRNIEKGTKGAWHVHMVITGCRDTIRWVEEFRQPTAISPKSGKKISGHALNKKDTADTLSKLKNGALIICKASEMNDATANVLHKALQQESQGIVIILEDTKRDIDKFLEKHEKLRECFTARMDVEALSNNTLVAFGKQYAREMEYSIDELGELALHTRIEDMQTIDHVVTVVDVKQIVDEAINHANKKTLKHFFDVLFAKRYDDEDMIILTEKDFCMGGAVMTEGEGIYSEADQYLLPRGPL